MPLQVRSPAGQTRDNSLDRLWAMEWTELVDAVEHRLGLFTGRATYERAVFLVEGFDLGAGTDIRDRLQRRIGERLGSGPIGWPWLLARQVDGVASDADLNDLLPEQSLAAIGALCVELRAALDE